ncbi:MAG: ABC transporter permease [Bacteroidales bacterium]|jgi:putative ABC transport system permease protein|nr:ABC transporter permease [Bacteroidales bacterium]
MSIKSSLIFWKRNKAYSFICLFGLIVSLAFVIIISNYTKNELSTDNFQTKADRIYVLGNESVYGCAYKLADHLIDRYPEIEKICVCTSEWGMPTVVGDNKYNTNVTFADTTFFELFDFGLSLGDKKTALTAMNSAIISESFANMVFGNDDPMGKPMNLNGVEVQITGVIKDIKRSLFPDFDILIRMEQIANYNSSIVDPDMSNAGSSVMFILTKEGTNIQAQIPDMLNLFHEIYWPYEMGHWKKVLLTPMRDVYFSDIYTNGFNHGNKTLVLILISVSALILIFAIINYINLTVAQSSFRAKEMATRRLLGASRLSVFTKLIVESLIMTFIAYLIALFIASGLDKPAGNLLDTKLSIFGDMTFGYLAVQILAVLIIGVISGLIPALIISNFKPIEVVKGTFVHKTKLVFSKVFITIQNVITIALITCSLIMILQVRFMLNAQLGYSTENIIDISNRVFDMPKAETFKNELLSLANVEEVAFAQGYPLNRGNNNTMKYNDKSISFQTFAGDSAYFKMMGFEIIQDNHIPNWGIWFNETAMKEMELPYDTLSVRMWGDPQNIAGIMKDFQYGSVADKIGPTMVYYENFKGEYAYVWSFLVKVTGDPVKALNDVKAVYEKISEGDVFPGEFIDAKIQEMYNSEKKTSTILSVFTIMAIVISTLGLYAMAVYFIRQRSGEIATRKIFGSNNNQIILKLLKSFLILVIIAFVISIPIIWYFMTNWLSDYPLHINLRVWMFLAGGTTALLIALLTVLYESVKAANANPVESIRR